MIETIFISDTHCHRLTSILKGVEAPLLIGAGDYLSSGSQREWILFLEDLTKLRPQFERILLTFGNHDRYCEKHLSLCRQELKEIGVDLLIDEYIEVFGLKIWGSPWSPKFGNWAFMPERGECIRRFWDLIPSGLDIMVVHGPPYGILDETPRGEKVGCEDLLEVIKDKKPKTVVFGHIHEQGGLSRGIDGITFINAAVCDEEYEPTNGYQRWSIPNGK